MKSLSLRPSAPRTGPRNGMLSGCFPLDPHYKALPEAKRVKAIKAKLGVTQ